ncbi:MAG: hypothetical protein F6K11_26845 [Leptolyngbya sp. SIO3F4]|nr:hypothetical protein [Leptolyngbya sp. SIO3F4]
MSNLTFSIEVLNHINQELSTLNLHNPLRYSAVLSSIGKTTHICHQSIPLKKIQCKETVIYTSAVPLKLEKIWQQPVSEIASGILTVLQNSESQPIWSSLRKKDNGWLEFVISQYGIEQWRQHLIKTPLPLSDWALPSPIPAEKLWKLQSGYELCCRWQNLYHQVYGQAQLQQITQTEINKMSSMSNEFRASSPIQQKLLHCLLDICDRWDKLPSTQLVSQASQLIQTCEQCVAVTRLSSPAARTINHWLTPSQIVLKQLLDGRLKHPIAERF